MPGTPDGDVPVQAAAEGARTPPQAQGRDSKYYDDPYPCPAEVAAKGAWEALRYRMKQYGLKGVLQHYGAWRYAVSLVPAYGVATGQLDLGHELGFAQLSPGTSTPSRPSLSRARSSSDGVRAQRTSVGRRSSRASGC